MAARNDKIQFRGEAEKEASRVVDEMRLGGVNISELARQGLREKLRETLSDEKPSFDGWTTYLGLRRF